MWAAQLLLVARVTRQLRTDSIQEERLTLPHSRSGCVGESSQSGSLRLEFCSWLEHDTLETPTGTLSSFQGLTGGGGSAARRGGAACLTRREPRSRSPCVFSILCSVNALLGSCVLFRVDAITLVGSTCDKNCCSVLSPVRIRIEVRASTYIRVWDSLSPPLPAEQVRCLQAFASSLGTAVSHALLNLAAAGLLFWLPIDTLAYRVAAIIKFLRIYPLERTRYDVILVVGERGEGLLPPSKGLRTTAVWPAKKRLL